MTEEFQSPQWGDNSKAKVEAPRVIEVGFSPRNGEIILNSGTIIRFHGIQFQSPQWGDNSKM